MNRELPSLARFAYHFPDQLSGKMLEVRHGK